MVTPLDMSEIDKRIQEGVKRALAERGTEAQPASQATYTNPTDYTNQQSPYSEEPSPEEDRLSNLETMVKGLHAENLFNVAINGVYSLIDTQFKQLAPYKSEIARDVQTLYAQGLQVKDPQFVIDYYLGRVSRTRPLASTGVSEQPSTRPAGELPLAPSGGGMGTWGGAKNYSEKEVREMAERDHDKFLETFGEIDLFQDTKK